MRKKFTKRRGQKPASKNSKSRASNYDKSKDSIKDTKMAKYEENDAQWYTGDSTLTFDAGRFNWYYPSGTLIDGVLPSKYSFPGVLAMYLYPGIGVSLDGTSAVNVAARKQYTWIRRSKSSYATYDPSDLMQYEISMSQAYQFYNWMCRLYGLLNLYSQINRYLPDALLSANLVNYNDLRSNMSDFLFYINKFGSQIASLAAPATLPYFKRQAWLYSSVYTDDHSGKSTLFMNCPAGFYVFDEANAQLVWTPLSTSSSNYLGLAGIMSLGDSIVNNILGCQDFWNISADILNAYGNDILTVSPLPVDYLVVPTFDLEVLSQIQNTWITGPPSVTQHANDISQNTDGQLIYNPRIPISGPASVANLYNKPDVVVNMYKDEVTPGDVFVATRMLPSFYTSGTTAYIDSCGTEFCGLARIYSYTEGATGAPTLTFTTFSRLVNFGNYSATPAFNTSNAGVVSKLSQISYHPHVYIYDLVNDGSANPTLDTVYPVGDVSNFTIMSPTDLNKLHLASLFSLFNVPTLGGFKG